MQRSLFSIERFNEIYGLAPEFAFREILQAKLVGTLMACYMATLPPATIASQLALGAYFPDAAFGTLVVPLMTALFFVGFPIILYRIVLVGLL